MALAVLHWQTLQFQHHAIVFIHRVGMEQVKLHLPDDMRPLRHIRAEHGDALAIARAAPLRVRCSKQFRASGILQRLLQMATGGVTGERGGVNAGDRAVAHHGVEHTQDGFGWRINSVSSRRSISVPRS